MEKTQKEKYIFTEFMIHLEHIFTLLLVCNMQARPICDVVFSSWRAKKVSILHRFGNKNSKVYVFGKSDSNVIDFAIM